MDDLLQFLKDRLAEDEAVAREAAEAVGGELFEGSNWSAGDFRYGGDVYVKGEGHPFAVGPWDSNLREEATHIARHDPARVLREVQAKRRILDRYADWAANPGKGEVPFYIRHHLEQVVRELALPYADHPLYREQEWGLG